MITLAAQNGILVPASKAPNDRWNAAMLKNLNVEKMFDIVLIPLRHLDIPQSPWLVPVSLSESVHGHLPSIFQMCRAIQGPRKRFPGCAWPPAPEPTLQGYKSTSRTLTLRIIHICAKYNFLHSGRCTPDHPQTYGPDLSAFRAGGCIPRP